MEPKNINERDEIMFYFLFGCGQYWSFGNSLISEFIFFWVVVEHIEPLSKENIKITRAISDEHETIN